MKKSNLIYRRYFYIIYVLALIALTAYFSLNIIYNRSLPITGKFYSPIQDTNLSYIFNEKMTYFLLTELEKWNGAFNEMKNKVVRNKNSEGFNDYEWQIEKPNNTFRIVALGDSFTEGAFISTNDSWPKQLERKLNQLNASTHFEVLNFGMSGAGTLEELSIFKENALKYKPDMVILEFYGNDLEDSLQIKKRANELWEMYKNGSFILPTVLEEKIKELNISKNDISTLFFIIAVQEFWGSANKKGPEIVWKENVETPLTELINTCKERKIELIVVGLDLNGGDAPVNGQESLNNLLSEYKVPFLNLTSYFPLGSNELRLPDNHLSEKGYDLLSTKLLEFLIQTNEIRIGR